MTNLGIEFHALILSRTTIKRTDVTRDVVCVAFPRCSRPLSVPQVMYFPLHC